ncbi:Tbingi protein [Trypanosoma cruzi]|nr:Tbingi protein [Trypanosoma cruzi]
MVALSKHIICARRHGPEARRPTVAGDWEPTHTDAILTRGEEAALAHLRTGVSHKYGWLPRSLRPRCRTAGTPRNSHENTFSSRWAPHLHDATPGRRRACRPGVVTQMSNADGVTRSHALWKAKFPGELEPPEIPPEPTPAT